MPSLLARPHSKIRDIGIGIAVYESFNALFDLVFYPVVIAALGVIDGALIATGISLLVNILIFWLYDRLSIDWLGAHALRQLEQEEDKSSVEHLISWLGKKKETWHEKLLSPIVFVGLTLPVDPVIVAVHYQKRHFQGITVRDWMLLIAATICANLWWAAKLGIVIGAVKWIWFALFT